MEVKETIAGLVSSSVLVKTEERQALQPCLVESCGNWHSTHIQAFLEISWHKGFDVK